MCENLGFVPRGFRLTVQPAVETQTAWRPFQANTQGPTLAHLYNKVFHQNKMFIQQAKSNVCHNIQIWKVKEMYRIFLFVMGEKEAGKLKWILGAMTVL